MASEQAATLLSVPTVLWSGVVAAAISLSGAVAGVILSNRSSERRLLSQLRHDSSEKQKDRVGLLRKEVYLQLFQELAEAGGHLGALAGKDPVKDNLGEPFQRVIGQLSKVQLVGLQQTALLAGELSSLYGEALFRLMLAAKPLHQFKVDIDLANASYQEHMGEAQRVIRERRLMLESGQLDDARFEALGRTFEHAQEQYEEARRERDEAWDSYNRQQPAFMQSVFQELKLIGPAQAKLLDAMRQELGLASDLEFMLQRVQSAQDRMSSAADTLLSGLGTRG